MRLAPRRRRNHRPDRKDPMNDAERLVGWLREGADEIENAHALLDAYGVPRFVPGREPTVPCTLAARIAQVLP